jgi:hypothetical protein
MIQPGENLESMSSEIPAKDQKRLSRRSAFKKAVQGGVALYVAPQILCSELVRAQGVVSGGLAGGGGGGGGTDGLPFLAVPAALGGLAAAGGGGAGAAALLPLIGEAPGGTPIAPGTTVAEGVVPGAVGTPGSPLGPAGPRATLPPEPLRRGRKGLKNKKAPATSGPKRAIRGLW